MLLVPSSFHLQYPQTKSCWNGVNLSMNLGPCLVVFDIKKNGINTQIVPKSQN